MFSLILTEPNIAAAIAFDQEGVLEMLSLAFAYTKIKCSSFVSLTVGSSRLLFLYRHEHTCKTLLHVHKRIHYKV